MMTDLPLDKTGRTIHFEVCPCTEGYPDEACVCGGLYTALKEQQLQQAERGRKGEPQ
jgi:hypothetical protein